MNEQENQMAEFEKMKKGILSKALDKEAAERLGRVRLANPVVAAQLEVYLVQMYQTGNLKERVNDSQMKKILDVLTTKKETKIKRVRK
jgi:programmed cell death protein 5